MCLDFPGSPTFLRATPAPEKKRRGNRDAVRVVLPGSPLREGWTRLVVQRQTFEDAASSKRCDVYYVTPTGKKLRSTIETKRFLDDVAIDTTGTEDARYRGLRVEDFDFSCRAFDDILRWTGMSLGHIADLQTNLIDR